ncbi:hypothetical protein, partial [Acinetobacter indicus]|uniref:hypothetical protein n=1 Tax=Acinetobacter indicus TaxID=756892 RepID=UPI0032B3AB74
MKYVRFNAKRCSNSWFIGSLQDSFFFIFIFYFFALPHKKECMATIAVPQFFTRGSSFELPLVLWVFYRVKIKLLKFFFQT